VQELVLVGGGELARVIIETARLAGWYVRGFVDPEPCHETASRLSVERLGGEEALEQLTDQKLVLGVGTIGVNGDRKTIVDRLSHHAERWTSVVHPAASVSATAKICKGAIILPGAVICSGSYISEHAIINLGAKVDHDVYVGKYVHIAPQAALGGGCRVEDDSYIGMGAIVRDHLTVSHGTLVGMGAVVSKPFPPGSTLVGIPAQQMLKKSGG
jgi:acetyltransferase EpsM